MMKGDHGQTNLNMHLILYSNSKAPQLMWCVCVSAFVACQSATFTFSPLESEKAYVALHHFPSVKLAHLMYRYDPCCCW